ncbi:hypothetical protein ACFVYJ_08365 [Pontibacter sp. JAM-7]|uniref:hypothetical protein n=1 Tax=Pontibacter sp. JAM-7 TaxID=3366581 RepID=UPI003AF534F7
MDALEQTGQIAGTGLYSVNTDRIQAAFDAQHSRYLIYRGRQGKRLLYHFVRMVAANPKSLRYHVKRIYLAVASYDSDALLGAFADFLLTLSGKGDPLFHRLLDQARPVIGEEHYALIMSSQTEGDLSELLSLCQHNSVLSRGNFPKQLII